MNGGHVLEENDQKRGAPVLPAQNVPSSGCAQQEIWVWEPAQVDG